MRLFLAVDLPPEIRQGIGRFIERMRATIPGWRWLRPEGIHLTLRFLGEVSPENDAVLRPSWRRVAAECAAVHFRIRGVGVFPASRSPRVLWLGIEEEAPLGRLAALASALEDAAQRNGLPPVEREFRPHLTIARAADRQRATPPTPDLDIRLAPVLAEAVVLFRSELQPKGARYTALEEFPLRASCYRAKE